MYLLASNTSWGMFGAGVLLLIFVLMRRSRRYLGKAKREQRAAPRQPLDTRRAPLADAPPELLRWQVEMHETARDLKAELDSKMSALQAVVRLAGEESARLEAAIARAEQLGISACADPLAVIEELDASHDSDVRIPPASTNADTDDVARSRDAIYELADQGFGANAIAQVIGAPLGDVEMLLSLRSAPKP